MQFADDPSQVGEKVGTNVRTYQREAGLGAEDQVEDNIAKRMRQFLSPLRGLPPFIRLPTACAVGCNLAPLRGWCAAGSAWAGAVRASVEKHYWTWLHPGCDLTQSG